MWKGSRMGQTPLHTFHMRTTSQFWLMSAKSVEMWQNDEAVSCGSEGETNTHTHTVRCLECGTKTCGLAEKEQGWVWVNKLKAKHVHKKELLSLANFHLMDILKCHMYVFPYANVKCVQPTWVQPTLQVSVYRCVKGEVCKWHWPGGQIGRRLVKNALTMYSGVSEGGGTCRCCDVIRYGCV